MHGWLHVPRSDVHGPFIGCNICMTLSLKDNLLVPLCYSTNIYIYLGSLDRGTVSCSIASDDDGHADYVHRFAAKCLPYL